MREHKLECQNFILTGESKTFALLKSLIHALMQYNSLSYLGEGWGEVFLNSPNLYTPRAT